MVGFHPSIGQCLEHDVDAAIGVEGVNGVGADLTAIQLLSDCDGIDERGYGSKLLSPLARQSRPIAMTYGSPARGAIGRGGLSRSKAGDTEATDG